MRVIGMLVLFLITFSWCQGQDFERDKIREIEQQKEYARNRQIRLEMDSGVYYLEHEQYERADEKLQYALAHMKTIPSDLAYYFGKNSYFLGKNKQSVDWLTKYIQLKGTTGQFSTDAAEWLAKAEANLLAEHQAESTKAVEVFSRDYIIDCGPSGKVTCPVCNGTTVIIKKDYFGNNYKSCPYCNQHGTLTCEEYNLLLRGQLKPHP